MPIFVTSESPVAGIGAGLDELVGGIIIVRVDGAGVTDSEDADTAVVVGVKFGFSNLICRCPYSAIVLGHYRH